MVNIDGTTIDDAEDLALVISMYNLIGQSSNYFETTGSLCFVSKKVYDFFQVIFMLNLIIITMKRILSNKED